MTEFTASPTLNCPRPSGQALYWAALSASSQAGVQLQAASSEAQGSLARLLHEVRQPLSGIESIAYYLEMALESEDHEIRQQCARLRTMARQANWLLTDASIGAGPEGESSCLNEQVFALAESLALHEERAIELKLPQGAMLVPLSACALRRMLEHLLSYLHDVAEADEPVSAATARGDGWCSLRLKGTVDPDQCAEHGRLLTALGPSGLPGVLARLGGSMDTCASGGVLAIELRLPMLQDEVRKTGV